MSGAAEGIPGVHAREEVKCQGPLRGARRVQAYTNTEAMELAAALTAAERNPS